MSPSPIPIKAWTPVMAANTVDSDAPPWPPMEYSITNANEEARTPRNPENIVAAMAPPVVLGNSLMRKRKASQPTRDVTIAMLRTFNPKTTTPPSAKRSAWTTTTTVTTSAPTQGPRRIAARAPPSRCPLVPAATGKLSICTAKTNAAVSPAIGICFSAKRLPVSLSEAQIPPAATAAPPTAVARFMYPSGMCTRPNLLLAPLVLMQVTCNIDGIRNCAPVSGAVFALGNDGEMDGADSEPVGAQHPLQVL